MKNRNLYIVIGVLLLILLGLAIWKGSTKAKGEEVTTEKAAARTITELVSASGKIYPEKEVKISPDVSGEVVELYVKEGDSVRAGQLLAKIKPDPYQPAVERAKSSVSSSRAALATVEATIQQIEAQKAQAEAQLENAQAAYTRSQQLFKDGVVSKADLDAARATARSADASVRAATAQINATRENASASNFNVKGAEATEREASTNLSKTLIYAPVNGIVSKLNVERGERVVGTAQMAGTEMMRISNFSSLEVRVDVSENDILRIALGNEADISVDAYLDRKFKGKVTEIAFSSKESATAAATSTDQVTNFVVRVRIDAASYADLMARGKSPFLPGMSAQVDVKTKSVVGALAIPVQSVTTRDLEAKKDAKPSDEDGIKVKDKKDQTDASAKKRVTEVVFVAIGDSVAKRAVTTGIQDDKYIQILTGLQEGDEVVSGPYSTVSRKLKSGMKISKNTAKKDTK